MRRSTLEESLKARATIGPFAAQVITAALKHNTVAHMVVVAREFKAGKLTLKQMSDVLFPSETISMTDQPAWLMQLFAAVKSTLIESQMLHGTATQQPIGILGTSPTSQSSPLN